MKRRKQYKPKHVLVNPLGYVLEGMAPVTGYADFLLDLKIKNHGSMTALTQGQATRNSMDALIALTNIVEALCILGFGKEYQPVMQTGQDALREILARGKKLNRFVVRAEEMTALNELMELHDAQMDVITVRDMDNAITLVNKTLRAKKAKA